MNLHLNRRALLRGTASCVANASLASLMAAEGRLEPIGGPGTVAAVIGDEEGVRAKRGDVVRMANRRILDRPAVMQTAAGKVEQLDNGPWQSLAAGLDHKLLVHHEECRGMLLVARQQGDPVRMKATPRLEVARQIDDRHPTLQVLQRHQG